MGAVVGAQLALILDAVLAEEFLVLEAPVDDPIGEEDEVGGEGEGPCSCDGCGGESVSGGPCMTGLGVAKRELGAMGVRSMCLLRREL